MKKIELLAPAGDLERLKLAIRYGANAVYIGGKRFSLRSRASNFDIEDIAQGVQFAKEHDAHIHVTVNMIPHEEDLEGLKQYLQDLERIGVSAIIVASYSIMKLAKEVAPNLEVHVSTQHSSTNSSVVSFWQAQGMDRVVLARECSLTDIEQTCANANIAIEAFIHGGMCISYSGRCTLSNNMTTRDANRGGCAQSCRWKYRLYDKDTPLYEEEHMFSMSSKDLCAIDYIPALIKAGVSSLKIEGRMKSQYYIASVIRAYRMCIDEYYAKGYVSETTMHLCKQELAKAENRKTAVGFYAGMPKSEDHLYGINGAGVSQEFIAYVVAYDKASKIATLEVRNNFSSNIECEAFGPHLANTTFIMGDIYDENNELLEVAKTPMQIVKVNIDVPLQRHDMIRKIMKEKEYVY
ncbi:MAG: U32 family peptidase [Erysipelotrichia bacterium]|nr:U32 family peptidase [Erysipelotrichia bacterium]